MVRTLFLFSLDPWHDFGRWLLLYVVLLLLFTVRGRHRATWGLIELLLGTTAVARLLPDYLPALSGLKATSQLEPTLVGAVSVVAGLIAAFKGMDNIDKAITTDWATQQLGSFRSEVRDVWRLVTRLARPKPLQSAAVQPPSASTAAPPTDES